MIRIAETEYGQVRGIEASDPRITAFKGIPFAAPPIGENRWRAPQPCASWEGIRECVRFAPIGMQDTPGLGTDIYCREWHVDPETPMSEDCLYLNIWTGAKTKEEKQPVLIWFFGGALQWGYPSEMEFNGERLARRGIIVVTINYRLNVFGFLAHKEITKAQPDAPTNFGNLDQQAALNWVIRNISEFGGDPNQITIAGQSAGGGSVLSQIACKKNEGKFQRAIVASAMIRSVYGQDMLPPALTLEEAEERGQEFFEVLGAKSLEEARKIDAKEVLHKYNEYVAGDMKRRMFSVIDQQFLVGDPIDLYFQNYHNKVSIMSGNTQDEFPNRIAAGSDEEFQKKANDIFGDAADEFLKFEEAWKKEDGYYAPVNGIECTVKSLFLENQKQGGENCYYYRFDTDIPGWDQPGTFHSVDLWFFFETLASCWRPFVGEHYDLSRQMCNYWANFIKTGDPNGVDIDGTNLPEWRPYTKEDPCSMVFRANATKQIEKETEFTQFMIEQLTKTLVK